MPNLKQLSRLKELHKNTHESLTKADIDLLLESFSPERISKGFENSLRTKSFSFPESDIQHYVNYFLERKKAEVVLLFIDITSFSQKFTTKTTDEIVRYLDTYYRYVIPAINKHGGEIEKIIGDGIICVFGEPFLRKGKNELHTLANKCSREIVSTLKDTNYEVKIALHFGEVMYYQNPTDEYYEYTMIGSALTELFRLEGVSAGNSINYFSDTYYDSWVNNTIINTEKLIIQSNLRCQPEWVAKNAEYYHLSGIKYKAIKRIEYMK